MQITVFRGTKEIGGTLIELKTTRTRLLLDAGYPLFLNGLPIDDSISKLPSNELLALGVLPAIEGLYSWDKPSFDAVLISHAHIDHYGLLKYLNSQIPVWMATGTKKLIEATQRFMITESYPINERTFSMYDPFSIGDFQVTPFLMDHSAFDAAAFELSAEGKTVIYSGDFRGHGRKGICLDRFIENATKQADMLFIEGSTLGRQDEKIISEKALEDEVIDQCNNFQGPILFQSSSQNIDRLVSFYRAAKKLNRTFVVDIYTANILRDLKAERNNIPFPSARFPDIKVFYPYYLTQKIFNQIGAEYAKQFSPQHISKEQIDKNQSRLIMLVRPSMKRDLELCKLHDGRFFYSLWSGYRDSNYQQNFENALDQRGFDLRSLHTSGHASINDIKRMINELNPKKIVPIHTLFPKTFLEFSDKTILLDDNIMFEL